MIFPIEKAPLNGDNTALMPKKSDKQPEVSKDLWIAPRHSLKGNGERGWESRSGAPNSSRLLELADIALGVKKPAGRKKRTSPASAHQTSKTEPYSGMKYSTESDSKR